MKKNITTTSMFPDILLKESVEAEAILYKILNSFLIL